MKTDLIFKLEKKREEAGLTKREVADFLGVMQQRYTNWVLRESLPKEFYLIAQRIVAGEVLLPSSGGSIQKNENTPFPSYPDNASFQRNVTAYTVAKSLIPLIPWNRMGDWMISFDAAIPLRMENTIFEHGESAFCFQSDDLSMASEYRLGEIIQVDPTVKPYSGCDVVAQLPDGSLLFRRLQISADGNYLLALNAEWPVRITKAPEGSRIVGVVTGSWMMRGRAQ